MVRILFNESYVFYPNGDEVPYETIFANLPMIEYFCFKRGNIAYNFSKTFTELLKIPHFRNLKSLDCTGISQSFDIDKFFQYLKQNKFTRVWLEFNDQISEEYKEKLETIIDEILDAELPRSFLPPYINFGGQLPVKKKALKNLFDAYYLF
uniref:DUF72 domain-containing protein n=1 Tax=Panagrolaimus davidi TaxID=227884 RepID=A0A914Q191_9BILA